MSNQVPYNPLWRAIEHTLLPRCRADDIAVLCYSSLQQGLLSGRFSSASEVPIGKRRTRLYGPGMNPEQCKCRMPSVVSAILMLLGARGRQDRRHSVLLPCALGCFWLGFVADA